MFWTRLISGIVLVILAVVILWLGPLPTCVAVAGLSLVGVFELCRVYKVEKKTPGVIAYIWTVFYYIVQFFGSYKIFGYEIKKLETLVMITYLLSILAVYVFKFPKYHDKEIMAVFLSFYYVSVMLSYVFKIRNLDDGGYFVVLVFICCWGNDTLAYVFGRLFGKHKMSPILSPKKSVEGLIGGLLGAGALGALFGLYFNYAVHEVPYLPLWLFIICTLGAVPAVIGDLAASAIKRNNDVKDYGTLIPGHGGVMDRFDSMIFAAPILYYLVEFVVLRHY